MIAIRRRCQRPARRRAEKYSSDTNGSIAKRCRNLWRIPAHEITAHDPDQQDRNDNRTCMPWELNHSPGLDSVSSKCGRGKNCGLRVRPIVAPSPGVLRPKSTERQSASERFDADPASSLSGNQINQYGGLLGISSR
jgi:hypothetical protein